MRHTPQAPAIALGSILLALGCWDTALEYKTYSTDSNASASATDNNGVNGSDPIALNSPCAGMVCNTPPVNVCSLADTRRVVLNASNGYCTSETGSADCRYLTTETTCLKGSCADGNCEEIRAQNINCHTPPASYCDGNELVVSEPNGVVTTKDNTLSCEYAEHRVPCPEGCQNNACVNAPCLGVTCSEPPARFCYENKLVTWSPNGFCNDDGTCDYAKEVTECAGGCVNGACTENDPCTMVTCLKPPANFCLNETSLYAYDGIGTCTEGACVYSGKTIDCNGPCVNGRCHADPCQGVSCNFPPPPRCTEKGRLLLWDGNPFDENLCEDGMCVYETTAEPMACQNNKCSNGRCVADACTGINLYCSAISPQVPHCEETTSVNYTNRGSCRGNGYCERIDNSEQCINGCDAGVCI